MLKYSNNKRKKKDLLKSEIEIDLFNAALSRESTMNF